MTFTCRLLSEIKLHTVPPSMPHVHDKIHLALPIYYKNNRADYSTLLHVHACLKTEKSITFELSYHRLIFRKNIVPLPQNYFLLKSLRSFLLNQVQNCSSTTKLCLFHVSKICWDCYIIYFLWFNFIQKSTQPERQRKYKKEERSVTRIVSLPVDCALLCYCRLQLLVRFKCFFPDHSAILSTNMVTAITHD